MSANTPCTHVQRQQCFFNIFTPLLHSMIVTECCFESNMQTFFSVMFRVDFFCFLWPLFEWMSWVVNEEMNERIDRYRVIIPIIHILQTFIRNSLFVCLNSDHVHFFMCSFCYLLLSPPIWVHIHRILEISIQVKLWQVEMFFSLR